MSTGRVESFSDGVLAVAITLLVLNIVVPAVHDGGATLGHALAQQWPEYAAYAISFITVGIIWINHHVLMSRLRQVDHAFMLLNLLLLMSVAVLPFATNLMATYLRASRGENLAAAIYGGALLVMGALFGALNVHILHRRPDLLKHPIAAPDRRRIIVRNLSGITPYLLATLLAAVSPYAVLAITAAVAVYYALPSTSDA